MLEKHMLSKEMNLGRAGPHWTLQFKTHYIQTSCWLLVTALYNEKKKRDPEIKRTYVSWVPKKKMGILFVGGFTAPSGTSST